MAWTSGTNQSGLYVTTFIGYVLQTSTTGAMSLATATHKIALHNSASLTVGTAPLDFSASTVTWANTGEVTGTNWAATGLTLTAAGAGTPTATISPTGTLMYDMNDVSVASTTLSAVRGCIIYADPVTAPTALVDAMIVAVNFGADFSTSNGTFGIQWAATGVATVDLTP
jgi:hypothetical protein